MIRGELTKQLRRARLWVGLGVLVAIPTIITIATKLDNSRPEGPPQGAQEGFFQAVRGSGLNVAPPALLAMSRFLLPVVVTLLAGDAIAGESNWGTLKYLLIRPVRRARLLAVKLTMAGGFTVIASLVVALTAVIAGTIAFGWHPMKIPFDGTLPPLTALGKIGLSTIYVAWDMAGIVAFAFMLSTMFDSAGGSVAAAVGFAVIAQILDNLNSLRGIHPALISHYWDAWITLFQAHVPKTAMWKGVLLQAIYVAAFCGTAFWWFRRRDVLA